MDPRKKKTTRDLSDLKAKLGLARPPDGGAPAPAGGSPHPVAQQRPAPVPHVGIPGMTPGLATGPMPGVMPPPGVVPPPGMAMPQPAQPAPDPRRNPFVQATPQAHAHPAYQPIVDAGPPLEIPQEKKSHTKLIVMLAITALVPLFVGWACGRIYGARILFNKGIDDAAQIKDEVGKMAEANSKIVKVLDASRARGRGKVVYDEKLIEELKDVLRASPHANAERAQKRQEQLFRTNYAMMEGVVVDRLFNYYNNTIRFLSEIESFIQKSESSKDTIKSYSAEAAKEDRKYGIIFAEDAGRYYLGQIVEVGNIDCTDANAKDCRKEDIKGFFVRTGASGAWSPRPGKPTGKQKFTDIIVPIIPDENWRQVAVGRRGYLAYREYVMGVGRLTAVGALLSRDERPLLQDLGKAAGRDKVFAPL